MSIFCVQYNDNYEDSDESFHQEEYEEIQNTHNEDKRITALGNGTAKTDRNRLKSASARITTGNNKNRSTAHNELPKSSKSRPNFEGSEP